MIVKIYSRPCPGACSPPLSSCPAYLPGHNLNPSLLCLLFLRNTGLLVIARTRSTHLCHSNLYVLFSLPGMLFLDIFLCLASHSFTSLCKYPLLTNVFCNHPIQNDCFPPPFVLFPIFLLHNNDLYVFHFTFSHVPFIPTSHNKL